MCETERVCMCACVCAYMMKCECHGTSQAIKLQGIPPNFKRTAELSEKGNSSKHSELISVNFKDSRPSYGPTGPIRY